MKIAYITNFKDMSCLNVQRELHVEIKQVDNENGHRHGHGGDDAGDEHKLLYIFLHIHSLLKNSLFSIFFYSPYQITVRIVHSLDPGLPGHTACYCLSQFKKCETAYDYYNYNHQQKMRIRIPV